jgi:hypothetical protein
MHFCYITKLGIHVPTNSRCMVNNFCSYCYQVNPENETFEFNFDSVPLLIDCLDLLLIFD